MEGPSPLFPFPAMYFGSLRDQEQGAKQGFRGMLCPTSVELYPPALSSTRSADPGLA